MSAALAQTAGPSLVWIVEDSPSFRRSLQRLLAGSKTLEAQAFASAEVVLAALRKADSAPRPDVLLLDIGLPGMSGLELIPEVFRLAPDCRVLILTVFHDEEKIAHSIKAGACGYLLKTAKPTEIIEAVHEACGGGSPMSPKVASNMVKLLARLIQPDAAAVGMSPREKQLLALMVEGLTAKEISDRLGISIHTTDSHTRHLFAKLGVRNRASAVARALKGRLV